MVRLMEKTVGSRCPRCGLAGLNIYFEDGGRSPMGARCDKCSFIGFFVNEELVPLEVE